MRVRIDGRLAPQARRVARSVAQVLHPMAEDVQGTAYLGGGAADLVQPDDPWPHVVVPLTTRAGIDPVARCQIAAADAIVATDLEEAVRLRGICRGVVVILEPGNAASVSSPIHTASPFDAAEVAAFLAAAPELGEALMRLGVDLQPFDGSRVASAVIEAATAAALESPR